MTLSETLLTRFEVVPKEGLSVKSGMFTRIYKLLISLRMAVVPAMQKSV